jgi:putative tryptophan/tyrosine transport system substrate-binding protein
MPQYVGLLHSGLKAPVKDQVTALKNKLGGVTLTETYADNKVETLEDNAEAFVGDPDCRVIIAAGGTLAAVVAQQVTERQDDNPRNRKPVVFTTVQDPSPQGLNLVDNLAIPGRNLTGTAGQTSELDPMRLKLLVALASITAPSKVGVLLKRDRKREDVQYQNLKNATNLELVRVEVSTSHRLKNVFKFFRRENAGGVVVGADSFFNSNRTDVVNAANDTTTGLPAIYQWRQFVEAGGLMSYGPEITEAYENAAVLAKRIINGESVGQISCLLPTRYSLVVNKVTAATLGYNVPDTLLGITVEKYPPPSATKGGRRRSGPAGRHGRRRRRSK